jgi:hypothetical protein
MLSHRNLNLSLYEEIIHLFDHILHRKTAPSLRPDVMRDMILKITENWEPQEKNHSFEILVNEKDARELEDLLYDSLQRELKNGVGIKPLKTIGAGFNSKTDEGEPIYPWAKCPACLERRSDQ